MSQKRKVRFDNFDDVVREAESLLKSGYDERGDWTLGEICDHLARSLNAQTGLSSLLPSFIQAGTFMMAAGLAQAAGNQQVPTLIPPETGIPDSVGVKRFKKAVKRFKRKSKNSGFLLFYNKTPRVVRRFHLRHCEHHFGFLRPRRPTTSARVKVVSVR